MPAPAFYCLSAAGNVLQIVPQSNALVADPTGKLWRVADITRMSPLVSIFLMGGIAAIAWRRAGRHGSKD